MTNDAGADIHMAQERPPDEPQSVVRAKAVDNRLSRRLLAYLMALGVLGGVVAGWVFTRPAGNDSTGESIAPQPASAAEAPSRVPDSRSPLLAEAIDLADRLLRDFPGDAQAVLIRGLILNKFVGPKAAVECWQQCIDMDPAFAEPHYWLGVELFKQGKYREGVAHLRAALDLGLSTGLVRLKLADALLNMGCPKEAIPVLQTQIRAAPDSAGGYLFLGQVYEMLGRLDEAADNYARAIECDPACYQAWHGLAMTRRRQGRREEAARCFEKCKELQLRVHEEHQAERRSYEDQASLRRSLATAYTDAGKLYRAHGNSQQAEACWKRAAEIDPRHTGCRAQLVDFYGAEHELEPMLAVLEQLAELEPGNVFHRLNLGAAYESLGRLDRAEAVLRQAMETAPDEPEGVAALVRFYLRNEGQPNEVVELARKLVALRPDAESYFLLAHACEAAGQKRQARAAVARAAELDPGNPQYRVYEKQLAGAGNVR